MKEISNKTRSGIIQNTYWPKKISVGTGKAESFRVSTNDKYWLSCFQKKIIGPKALTVWSS